MDYSKHFNTKQTSQSEPIPGKDMVENNAGGYTFAIDHFAQLQRFLILGAEGGSYYITERKMTIDNAKAAMKAIGEDPFRVVDMVVEISQVGRAPKNDPALFVLAMVVGMSENAEARSYAMAALPKVARIGTHLYHFLTYVQAFRGWGRSLCKGVARWYEEMPAEKLALQAIKYRQRDGWTHRDVLRKAHPITTDSERQKIFRYMAQGERPVGEDSRAHELIRVFEDVQKLDVKTDKKGIIHLVENFRLPWEALTTEQTADTDILRALMYQMPLGALTRQLAKLTMRGVLTPGAFDEIDFVVGRLTDEENIRRSRLHPISILAAMKTYSQGHGERGKSTWTPIPQVLDALDEAFYKAFGNVEPTGKRIMVALDVSGSMSTGINGIPNLSAREAAAAMALVTLNVEKKTNVVGFTSSLHSQGSGYGGWVSDGITPLSISARQRLDDVTAYTRRLPFGGTDCALPMMYALAKKEEYDAIICITDNETWAGSIHPSQALQQYRQKMGLDTKLVVMATSATNFSIADPNDRGMLDVVGFDTATPQIISDFIAGKI